MPALGAEGPPLGRQQRAIGALDLRHVRPDAEARADRLLQMLLGLPERGAQRAAVLERMRHVAQVRLRGVVHQGREHVLGIPAALLHQLGHDHRMLRDRVERAAVPAEAAQVPERPRDVLDVELLGIGIERVHALAGHRLQVRPGLRRRGLGRGGHRPVIVRCGRPIPPILGLARALEFFRRRADAHGPCSCCP
jgi:hypothetical protein